VTKIRVITADDHAILRAGMRLLINARADMEVVGEAENGQDAIALCQRERPDVAVLDLTMPVTNGIQAAREIRRLCPGTRILILTMHVEQEYVRTALAAGASGYLTKKAADLELPIAIRTLHRGQPYIDASIGFDVLADLIQRPLAPTAAATGPKLSEREEEVLRLLARGYTNQEIATRLFVSVKTVETYRGRLAQKLGLKKRAQIVRFALEMGLLTPEGTNPGE
jgi:two-component system, NarL family, response regulator NreC